MLKSSRHERVVANVAKILGITVAMAAVASIGTFVFDLFTR